MESQIVAKSLELARDIQMGLVPQQFPALPEVREVDIFAMMTPALQVGGDLYDYFLLDSSQICFIIGDVSEKGIPAAFFMATAHTAFKMAAIGSSWSIALTMRRVNEFLCSINPQQMFVTAFAGILDLRTGELEYADAGHEPPLVVEDAGTVRMVDKEGNVVLGFLRDNDFRSGTLRLAPGDALVLYTDGVSEAMDTQHRLFGIDGIERALTRAAAGSGSAELVMRLSADIGAFVGAAKQSDDITILVIRYLGPAGSEDVAVPSDKRAVDER